MVKCPQDCQDKHSGHIITMTKIFGKLDNIEEKLEQNTLQHEELIITFKDLSDKKADKIQVDDLYTKYWIAVTGLVGLLITIIIMLIQYKK